MTRPTGAKCGVHVGEMSRVETTQYYRDHLGQTKPLKSLAKYFE